jgi:two-component system, sensor histidine kinase and response regulator
MKLRPTTRFLPTVLLVDDDPELHQLVRLMLRRQCDVLVASSAGEARRQLADHPEEIQLILMDIGLAGVEDGLTLTRELRAKELWTKLPIVAETAHVLPEDRSAALRAGCDEFLAKPFYPSELRSLVDRFLKQASDS